MASKSEAELRGIYHKISNTLVKSASQNADRRNALASLENISRELNYRYADQWKKDAGL